MEPVNYSRLDDQPGLIRQRRNLILMSIFSIIYVGTGASIKGFSMNGLGLIIERPQNLDYLFIVCLFYFLARYYSYLSSASRIGSNILCDIIKSKLQPEVIFHYTDEMQTKIKNSLESLNFKVWIEETGTTVGYRKIEQIYYKFDDDRHKNWTGNVSTTPSLIYKLGIPRWQSTHYDLDLQRIEVTIYPNAKDRFKIIRAEIKAILQEPYYFDYKFPFILGLIAITFLGFRLS